MLSYAIAKKKCQASNTREVCRNKSELEREREKEPSQSYPLSGLDDKSVALI